MTNIKPGATARFKPASKCVEILTKICCNLERIDNCSEKLKSILKPISKFL